MHKLIGRIGATWGVLGVLLLLGFAIVRLTGTSLQAFEFPMDWRHYFLLIANIVFMAHAEGYKGFHKSYSPRVVKRAQYLSLHWTPVLILLAPLFCMGFIHSTKRRQIAAWALTVMIVLLILIFRTFSQPWRGVLDAGVVVGLALGTASILYFTGHALTGRSIDCSAEVPDENASQAPPA